MPINLELQKMDEVNHQENYYKLQESINKLQEDVNQLVFQRNNDAIKENGVTYNIRK